MKSITIDVPRDGTQITIHPRGQATQVVVVVPDDVELRVSSMAPGVSKPSKQTEDAAGKKSDLAGIATRLRKLKVSTRVAAEHSIGAMFHFGEPAGEVECRQIFDRLLGKGLEVE